MIDEGMVGERRAVSTAVRAHDQLIFFVVAWAVTLVEDSEFLQHLQLNQEAEAYGCRNQVVLRQVTAELAENSVRFLRLDVAKLLLRRKAANRGVVRTGADKSNERIAGRNLPHFS